MENNPFMTQTATQAVHRVDLYFQDPAISQSYLKEVMDPGKKSNTDFDYHMGKIADSLLYTPELFDRDYHVSDDNAAVPDTLREILREVIEESHANDLHNVKHLIVAKAREKEYMKNIVKEETLLNNLLVVKKGEEYYNALLKANGKKVINSFDFGLANRIVSSFRTALAHLKQGWEQIEYQVPIYFFYNNSDGDEVKCKSLLDAALINMSQKRIKIIDTKVTDIAHSKYKLHALRFRYDFQLAFYRQAVREFYGPGWIVELPVLVVYSNVDECTKVYELSEADLIVGQYGAKHQAVWQLNHAPTGGAFSQIQRTSEIFGFHQAIDLVTKKRNIFESSTTPALEIDKTGLWQ